MVESSDRAAYAVEGYERERDQGGANHIVGRTRKDRQLWHDRFGGDCFDLHLAGGNEQGTLI